MGGVTQTQDSAQTPPQQPPAKRRGMPGNAKSMVISMVVILVGIAMMLAMDPRPKEIQRTEVDVAGIARAHGEQYEWQLAYPQPAPDGARSTNVRMIVREDADPTWQAGYDLPDGHYVAVKQTQTPEKNWVAEQVGDAPKDGTLTIDGATWTKYTRDDGNQVSIVRDEPLDGLATVVTGKTDYATLEKFAKALKPYRAE